MSTTSREGEISVGKRSSTAPFGVTRVYDVPATSGGCSTQKPIRFFRNVRRATPSNVNINWPVAFPSIVPCQAKSTSPPWCSAASATENESGRSVTSNRVYRGSIVAQFWSRTAA